MFILFQNYTFFFSRFLSTGLTVDGALCILEGLFWVLINIWGIKEKLKEYIFSSLIFFGINVLFVQEIIVIFVSYSAKHGAIMYSTLYKRTSYDNNSLKQIFLGRDFWHEPCLIVHSIDVTCIFKHTNFIKGMVDNS